MGFLVFMDTKQAAASKTCKFSFLGLAPELYGLWILKIFHYNRKDDAVKKW